MVKSFRNACGDDMTQTILSTNKCFRPCSSDFSPLVPGYEIRVELLSSFVINNEISIQEVPEYYLFIYLFSNLHYLYKQHNIHI